MPILSGAIPAVPSASATIPDLETVRAYLLASGGTSASDADIQDALDAEWALQVSACGDRTAAYPAPLGQALMRRVQRALAMRAVILGLADGGESGPQRVAGRDAEIRRMEAPYRRLVTG